MTMVISDISAVNGWIIINIIYDSTFAYIPLVLVGTRFGFAYKDAPYVY